MNIPIHWGERTIDDRKLVNTITLSSLEPEIFPQVVVADSLAERPADYFPMTLLPGKDWDELYSKMTTQEHILVLGETVKQIEFIYNKYGILLRDRHAGNIRVDVNDNFRVWQIDLEDIYDVATDQMFLPNIPELRGRSNITPLSQRSADIFIGSVLDGLFHSLSVAFQFAVNNKSSPNIKLESKLSSILEEMALYTRSRSYEKISFTQVKLWIDLLLEAAK